MMQNGPVTIVASYNASLFFKGHRLPGLGETIVADEFQHHGIGTLLLDELARAARERGVEAFRADTLAENSAMLDVFRHAGFPVSSSIEYGTVTLRFPIQLTDDYRAALAAREATRSVQPGAAT